ncbi:aldo/keto reductase [Spirosoma flavum]|uniref:Aldo/keto reductase n=1 Tax=Spirosoma flavum TaxID=2048557 RepID=A0ABW6AJD1_9BACT
MLKAETTARETEILDTLEAIAKEHNTKVLAIALAWIRQKRDQSTLSTVIIIGPRTSEQLDDNLASLHVTLTAAQLQKLNDVSTISLGSPHEIVLTSGFARSRVWTSSAYSSSCLIFRRN